MDSHFILTGDVSNWFGIDFVSRYYSIIRYGFAPYAFILERMKKYKIKRIMVTIMRMSRMNLITKERMERFCNGKESQKLSVNDDLESLFDNIQFGEVIHDITTTYFLPKLTKEQLKLVAEKDSNFMQTFAIGTQYNLETFEKDSNFMQTFAIDAQYNFNPDVDKAEMEASESDSKFVQVWGWRNTITIENSLKRKTCT